MFRKGLFGLSHPDAPGPHSISGWETRGASAPLPQEPQSAHPWHTWALSCALLVMWWCLKILTVSVKNSSRLKAAWLNRYWRSTQGNRWTHRYCKCWECEEWPGIELHWGLLRPHGCV